MKQIILIAVLIFIFCFTAFAQTNQRQSKAKKISEYWEDPGSENGKFSVYDLYKELQKNQNAEGIIKIQARENRTIILQIRKIRTLINFLNADLTRFSFALSSDDEQLIQYWLVPSGEDILDCENCVIIRAEDYNKLENFFHPKPKLKKRKK